MNMALVIKFVGSVLMVSVLGIVTLAVLGRVVPDPLVVIASSSLTGLVGLLAQPHNEPPPT